MTQSFIPKSLLTDVTNSVPLSVQNSSLRTYSYFHEKSERFLQKSHTTHKLTKKTKKHQFCILWGLTLFTFHIFCNSSKYRFRAIFCRHDLISQEHQREIAFVLKFGNTFCSGWGRRQVGNLFHSSCVPGWAFENPQVNRKSSSLLLSMAWSQRDPKQTLHGLTRQWRGSRWEVYLLLTFCSFLRDHSHHPTVRIATYTQQR